MSQLEGQKDKVGARLMAGNMGKGGGGRGTVDVVKILYNS